MFLDSELTCVKYEQEPHFTHSMTDWRSTICQLSTNDRFGRKRKCKKCGGQDYLCGGAGSRWQDSFLARPCEGQAQKGEK